MQFVLFNEAIVSSPNGRPFAARLAGDFGIFVLEQGIPEDSGSLYGAFSAAEVVVVSVAGQGTGGVPAADLMHALTCEKHAEMIVGTVDVEQWYEGPAEYVAEVVADAERIENALVEMLLGSELDEL